MSLTAIKVRQIVKDKKELNILLENDFQSPDPLIDTAMDLAVSDFNAQVPLTNYNRDNFPNEAVLLYGTLHYLAAGEAERQLRNQVNYNAQGMSTNLDDKFPQYQKLASYYYQMFMQKAQQLKKFINMESAWGGVESAYSSLNEFKFRT